MKPVAEDKVPQPHAAAQEFSAAMEQGGTKRARMPRRRDWRAAWDITEAFELFARFGARDFRDIGHKAIYVANSFRTLNLIGWQNAEPVLRSLAYALLKSEGQNPAQN